MHALFLNDHLIFEWATHHSKPQSRFDNPMNHIQMYYVNIELLNWLWNGKGYNFYVLDTPSNDHKLQSRKFTFADQIKFNPISNFHNDDGDDEIKCGSNFQTNHVIYKLHWKGVSVDCGLWYTHYTCVMCMVYRSPQNYICTNILFTCSWGQLKPKMFFPFRIFFEISSFKSFSYWFF